MDPLQLYGILNRVLDKNPDLQELGLLLTPEPDWSQEPGGDDLEDWGEAAPFVIQGTALGVALWCAAGVYKAAMSEFLRYKKKSKSCGPFEAKVLLRSTRACLLVNADNYTALNIRKSMILQGHQSGSDELRLLNFVFSKHPKSAEAWAHRRWVLNHMYHGSIPEDVVFQELNVCQRTSELYPKNYHSWTHRQIVMEKCGRNMNVLRSEFVTTHRWIRTHVSDHCGFHYRQLLLDQILTPPKNQENSATEQGLGYLTGEIRFLNWLIEMFPGHEAVWCHRRFLFERLAQVATCGMWQGRVGKRKETTEWSVFDWNDLKGKEVKFDELDELPEGHSRVSYGREFDPPTIQSEIDFAIKCATDDGVSDFEQQRACAWAYLLWVTTGALLCLRTPGIPHPFFDKTISELQTLQLQTQQSLLAADPIHSNLWMQNQSI